eukprot:691389-Prorocentrum_minimum.AAC.3
MEERASCAGGSAPYPRPPGSCTLRRHITSPFPCGSSSAARTRAARRTVTRNEIHAPTIPPPTSAAPPPDLIIM